MRTQVVRAFMAGLLCWLLASCESTQKNIDYKNEQVPVRAFLISGDEASREYIVQGYVLFSSEPSKNNLDRYLNICSSYIRHFDYTDEFEGKLPKENLMPTYWLLNSDAKRIADRSGYMALLKLKCADYVKLYDYSRSKIILSKASSLSAKGPVLAAWSNRGTHNEFLLLDLSNFDEADYERAMLIWKERIVKKPNIWNDGFNITKVKEEFRNFVQKYGEVILSVISA